MKYEFFKKWMGLEIKYEDGRKGGGGGGKGHRIRGYGSVLSQWLGLATPESRNKNWCNMKNMSPRKKKNATF